MAEISIYSGDFREAISELDALNANNALTGTAHDDIMKKYGFDPDEFLESYEEYNTLSDEEKQQGASIFGDIPIVGDYVDVLDVPTRIGGRALGDAGRGLVEFGEDIFPETTQKAKDIVGSIADTTGQYIPESLKEYADQLFNPYHGEGIYGVGEQTVGQIGSYFVPMGGLAKLHKLTKGALGLNKTLKAGINNLEKVTGKPGTLSRYAVIGAGGVTMVEDPQDNIVNVMTEQFPESLEFLEKIAVDPNDTPAQQRLNAFLNNLGLEVGVFGGFKGLGELWKKSKDLRKGVVDTTVLGTQPIKTFVDKPFQYMKGTFSSRRGMTDEHLEDFIFREAQSTNAAQRAHALAKELKALIKNYRLNPDDVTRALARDPKFRNKMPEEVKKILDEMNENVGSLNSYLTKNDRVSKGLTAAINKNGDTYLTTSYRMFDDPVFKKQMKKTIEKNIRNIKAENIDSITDVALRDATSFLLNDMKLSSDDAIAYLRSLTGDVTIDKFGDELVAMAGKASAGARSSKALMKKKQIPDPLKALMGEVTDPTERYLRTFEKLATYKSEIEFMEKIADDLVTSGQAIRGNKGAANLDLVDLTNVGESRLGQIFGRTPTKKDAVKNPLEKLYADPLYRKALQEGLDAMTVVGPKGKLGSTAYKSWALLKVGSQYAKTVANPLTHSRNVFGNVIFMAANGFTPIGLKSGKEAVEYSIAKLGGLNNRELAEKMSRYRELGLTGSDVGIGIIKRNFQDLGMDPNTYFKKALNAREAAKFAPRKLAELYQVEDDIFKIMHFEKTKDYLSKAFPDKSLTEIERLAATRTRDLLPNYTLAPRFLKSLRLAPVGDFSTFAAESLRISKNLMKYTINDAMSGNSVLTGMAAKRMGGMTMAGLGGDFLWNKSKMLMGITDEQSEALQNVGERWEVGNPNIHLSPIKKVNGRFVADSISIGTANPFAYPLAIARTLHKLANDENVSEGDIASFVESPEGKKSLLGLWDKTLTPFIGTSMSTDAILDALAVGRSEDPTVSAYGDLFLKSIGKAIEPGFLTFMRKRKKWEQEQEVKDEVNRNKGAPAYSLWSENHKGFNMNIPDEASYLGLLGFKTRRQDISASVPFNLGVDLRNIRKDKNSFSQLLKAKIPLWKQYYNPEREKFFDRFLDTNITIDDLKNSYINDEEQTLKNEQGAVFMIDQYLKLGLDQSDIIKSLKVNKSTPEGQKVFDTFKQLTDNLHRSYNLTDTDISNFKKFLEGRTDLDTVELAKMLRILRDKFDRTKIDKDK